MPRGGKRSTSFKPGQSGNSAGSSRKQWELRRRRRNTERAFVDAVAIQLEITTAAAADFAGEVWSLLATSGTRKQLPLASSKQQRGTSA
jgi:hypothetical protein